MDRSGSLAGGPPGSTTTGIDDLPAGADVLATGPPLSGLDRLGARFVADSLDRGEAGIVLATDRDAASVAESVLAHATGERAAERLGVVDTVGREPPAEPVTPVARRRPSRSAGPRWPPAA